MSHEYSVSFNHQENQVTSILAILMEFLADAGVSDIRLSEKTPGHYSLDFAAGSEVQNLQGLIKNALSPREVELANLAGPEANLSERYLSSEDAKAMLKRKGKTIKELLIERVGELPEADATIKLTDIDENLFLLAKIRTPGCEGAKYNNIPLALSNRLKRGIFGRITPQNILDISIESYAAEFKIAYLYFAVFCNALILRLYPSTPKIPSA